ncbi:hypothetical protein OH77DRAFT_1440715 [Trametes cingulata]|nr:hypothetical protein OH77DRAFT_1440715 [Trametes cingulata]
MSKTPKSWTWNQVTHLAPSRLPTSAHGAASGGPAVLACAYILKIECLIHLREFGTLGAWGATSAGIGPPRNRRREPKITCKPQFNLSATAVDNAVIRSTVKYQRAGSVWKYQRAGSVWEASGALKRLLGAREKYRHRCQRKRSLTVAAYTLAGIVQREGTVSGAPG